MKITSIESARRMRQALGSLGYREDHPQKWMKPVGHIAFVFDEAKMKLISVFPSAADGTLQVWDTHTYDDCEEDPFSWIRDKEAQTPVNKGGNQYVNFTVRYFDL